MIPIIRASRDDDLAAITRIYGHWVRHGLASFEYEPPAQAEMAARRQAILAQALAYLVAEDQGGLVLGYAYAGPYRTRRAYGWTVEDSIYVAPEATGLGVGRLLLPALIAETEAAGKRLMVAVIGDSANAASIALHTRHGFKPAGVLPNAGWKFGRWVDSVLMTRALGAGAGCPPEEVKPAPAGDAAGAAG
jgi:L-amino acid N-acyltransferase YncA